MRELGGHRDGVVKRRAGAIVEVDLEVGGPELLAALGQRPGALQLGATSLPRAHPRGVRVGGVEGVLVRARDRDAEGGDALESLRHVRAPKRAVGVDEPHGAALRRQPEEDVLPPIAHLQLSEAVRRRQVVAVELGAQPVGRARLVHDRRALAQLAHRREQHVALRLRHALVDGEGRDAVAAHLALAVGGVGGNPRLLEVLHLPRLREHARALLQDDVARQAAAGDEGQRAEAREHRAGRDVHPNGFVGRRVVVDDAGVVKRQHRVAAALAARLETPVAALAEEVVVGPTEPSRCSAQLLAVEGAPADGRRLARRGLDEAAVVRPARIPDEAPSPRLELRLWDDQRGRRLRRLARGDVAHRRLGERAPCLDAVEDAGEEQLLDRDPPGWAARLRPHLLGAPRCRRGCGLPLADHGGQVRHRGAPQLRRRGIREVAQRRVARRRRASGLDARADVGGEPRPRRHALERVGAAGREAR